MLLSISKSIDILRALPLIKSSYRKRLTRLIKTHRLLMCFFVVGYIIVVWAFMTEADIVGKPMVSAIFFFGSVFVFVGTFIQTQMLGHIQDTISELLPICANCRKIRNPETAADDPASWEQIESYIQHNTKIDFTHSYCPDCAAAMIQDAAS